MLVTLFCYRIDVIEGRQQMKVAFNTKGVCDTPQIGWRLWFSLNGIVTEWIVENWECEAW